MDLVDENAKTLVGFITLTIEWFRLKLLVFPTNFKYRPLLFLPNFILPLASQMKRTDRRIKWLPKVTFCAVIPFMGDHTKIHTSYLFVY